MFGINGWEVILLALIAVFILGPDKLPEYAAKLARGIRQLRVMAEGAKDQLRDQLGPEYEDIDWRQYDPRQYDPRRIVRDALREPLDDAFSPVRDEIDSVRSAARIRGDKSASNGGAAVAGAAGAAGAAAASARTGTAGDPGDPGDTDDDYAMGYVDADGEAGPDVRIWSGPQEFDPLAPVPYDLEAT